MKPSERIKELIDLATSNEAEQKYYLNTKSHRSDVNLVTLNMLFDVLVTYLDEQYEKERSSDEKI